MTLRHGFYFVDEPPTLIRVEEGARSPAIFVYGKWVTGGIVAQDDVPAWKHVVVKLGLFDEKNTSLSNSRWINRP